ncbi:SusC/RagA family TonB-linked outer membrane protein [Olivibacter sp. SDN3]|uniref:SusC/RagA family TonB-linked outer membrane protein n=1 Tax=Olivibacter sp. SDN3 TaxID=2764720 RepID=UPI0016512405|nr:SusC/RagA family TonB-linked outer membrane protein [Olivibacter sp. SDN3]QNL49784.1 SusC/RagA family TonB-linked outer membrane protein [Olivibacter sp. SDN3]
MKSLFTLMLSLTGYLAYCQTYTIKGTVKSSADDAPLAGATIQINNTRNVTKTDQSGNFTINIDQENGRLKVSYLGYQNKEIDFDINSSLSYNFNLDPEENSLDEAVVIGYGETSRRFNTGSISSITAKEIEQQPVTNVLSALSGRMPGVFVQTTNGLPGGNINIQIRGTGSIAAGTSPLYIIDGVPFDGTFTNPAGALTSQNILGAISPLNSLNPNDIESITVLKDADATAIYGSRGSNGVVLITTKKGQNAQTQADFNVQFGTNSVANYPDLLEIQEYLKMRNEAFLNDNRLPSSDPLSPDYAPDLMVWDTTQNVDWPKYLLGNNGNVTNIQASVSGGNNLTSFRLGANYRKESTILAGESSYKRTGFQVGLNHSSDNQKFKLIFSGTYNTDDNRLPNPTIGLNQSILLPPNYPLFNPDNSYNWYAGVNPLAQLEATSDAKTNNIVGNITLSYSITPELNIKASAGYNSIDLKQTQIFPSNSLYPGTVNYTNFGTNDKNSFIVEPQIEYMKIFQHSKMEFLVGATYQSSNSESQFIRASNFSNESLMENLSSAGTVDSRTNNFTDYKYASVFGRITYNLFEKYIFNGVLRRDGSSRFGPNNRFGNFGSVGLAWVFSNENWIKDNISVLSYGKLRVSYGKTGNDQIIDYQYLSTYSSGNFYQDISGLRPSRIANDDFKWETTKKLEAALEIGAFKDRILISTGYYFNESDDQLVGYPIPTLTGFSSYQANLPAVVQNSGLEVELNTVNIQNKNFRWSTTFNITLPKNKLESFTDLENSSYRNTHEIGYDITRIYGYQFIGVDPNTGLGQYSDEYGQASSVPYGYHRRGKRSPEFYGGIGNSIIFKNFQLDVFGQFSKQMLEGGLLYSPGAYAYNNYSLVLDRWANIGDNVSVPKSSNLPDFYYNFSTANLFDVYYFRIKNISLSYSFSDKIKKTLKSKGIRLSVQMQNLFTFWDKNSAIVDPESGAISSSVRNIPPVKAIIFGAQFSL